MRHSITDALRFYFITDDNAPLRPLKQIRIALAAGATTVQYRHKSFKLDDYHETEAIAVLCRRYRVPFIINDHVLLAKGIGADGVHVGQDDTAPELARHILGAQAIIGLSVSNRKELESSNVADCDYIGTGPAFTTRTKADAKAVRGLEGLAKVAAASSLPMVAIGGITTATAASCFQAGATGVAVISHITRAHNPEKNAMAFGKACGCPPRNLKTTE